VGAGPDRAGLPRGAPFQLLHRLYVRRAGGGHTAPVLVTKDGVLRESADIVAWADDRVDPADRLIPDEWVARECEPRKRGTHLPRCR
jgi:hypothetical protein